MRLFRNISTWIMLIVMLIVMTACSPAMKQYAIDSSSLAIEVSIFKKKYENIEQLMRTKQATQQLFSDADWRKLLNVDASIDMIIMRADAIVQLDPDSISVSDVEMMYTMTKAGYGQAYQVINSHWADFDPSEQILLESLDKEAKLIDEKIDLLMNDPSNENITKALTLITGVLGIAIKMIGVAVI